MKIVTDSTSDLPPGLVQRYQIEIVPNILVLDGKTYRDGEGISREEFYNRLPHLAELPTTATASSGEYQVVYENLFRQKTNHILSIHAAANLTGIYNAACAAAAQVEGRVTVIDSGQVSLGLGFQALAAAQAAEAGLPEQEILQQITDVRRRVRVIAMLDTLEYIQRSGRVSWAKTRLASFLDLRPFIELNEGKVLSRGEARTRSKGIQRLGTMLEDLGRLENLAILHTNAMADALAFQAQHQAQAAQPTWLCNVTTVIGTHVGPNGLGFVAVLKPN